MKELDHIKKIENEVSKKINVARASSEKNISVLRGDRDSLVERKLAVTMEKLKKDSEQNKKSAEKEASDMIKASDTGIRSIQGTAERNFSKAVDMILEVLRNDKS